MMLWLVLIIIFYNWSEEKKLETYKKKIVKPQLDATREAIEMQRFLFTQQMEVEE